MPLLTVATQEDESALPAVLLSAKKWGGEVTCAHPNETLYDFDVPGVGPMQLCWNCRKEIVIRCHLYEPTGMVCADLGTIGYQCKTCKGEFTTTWAGTCTCAGRKERCDAASEAVKRWRKFAELCLWKPKKERAGTGMEAREEVGS